jgi:glyoxylase-like metal-dependent hydrolase (beta-lactamase superfamily II)
MSETSLTVETLREMLNQGQPVTLLDVRHAHEWAEWAIPGSVNADVYDALKANDPAAMAGVELPGDRPVVTVCGAGVVSQLAAKQLRGRGLPALSLTGGMKAWSLAWNSAAVPLLHSGARIIQVRRAGKGCLSYLVGSQGQAAVIDPALSPEVYLDLAQEQGWAISHIFETHIHADHLSRARQLAERAGAVLHLPAQERATFPFQPIQDNAEFIIGAARLAALHTPGHTGESTSYLLDNQAVFTGDTLFLTSVGRPDLEAAAAESQVRARLLYHSLRRLLTLAPATLILPGHTSDPILFDGKPIATSLAEVSHQTELLHLPEDAFVETVLTRIPPTPPNHQRIVELNEAGLWPDDDPTNLEAGANRCAVA